MRKPLLFLLNYASDTKGYNINMNKEITIIKNTSCQFPVIITENRGEVLNKLIEIKKLSEKEFLFLTSSKDEMSYTKELKESLDAEVIFTEPDKLTKVFQQAISENKILVWFVSKDYETVVSLKDCSLKGFEYILVPTTPIAQITCEYIYDIWNTKAIESFPLAIINDSSLWNTVSEEDYICGLASVLRKGIQENAIFYEWFLGNMYEVFDKDSSFIKLLLEKNASLLQKRFDKKTAAARCVPHFGSMFEFCISNACKELPHADVISMACLMHAYLAWGKKILSMEEFYEIRDMFVAFDMRISETNAKAEVLIDYLRQDNTAYTYKNFAEFPYLCKIGKIITDKIPTEKDLLDAAMAVYFDEEAMA